MDTQLISIFTDATSEFVDIQSASPHTDLTDWPLPPSLVPIFTSSTSLGITSAVADHGYMEVEFNLAQDYWGINFNFGNDPNGVQIRQGIAHMLDKSAFAANDPSLVGQGAAVDNPLPTSNGGLPTPNPCSWDANFPESGTNCVVGASGGTSYRLASATGANGVPWLQAPGSADLDAAAQHFVNAGLATGFNSSTSVLTGISSAAASHPVNFFVRNDDPARLDVGNGIAEQICYLFTGSYSTPCTYLTVTRGPSSSFGFCIDPSPCNPPWWMYTARFSAAYPFDSSLYFGYNSRFVQGSSAIQPPNGPCSSLSVPTVSPSDFVSLCSPTYDSISSQMESAPCLQAVGDPSPGQTNNGPGANCPGTNQLSAISAGVQAEDTFGKGAFTISIFQEILQYGYLYNGWTGIINGDGSGLPNTFTWLNAWNQNPTLPGTMRQGFAQTTRSVNPYLASTYWDSIVLSDIYDTLSVPNPMSAGQLFAWMTYGNQQLSNSSLTYQPPHGTKTTFRFTLRSDAFFHDGRKVTAFDVAFSYLSLIATGSFQGGRASSMIGITVLGPNQFDINLNSLGPFTLPNLTSLTIVPGHYWTNAGSSSWENAITTCTINGAPCYPVQYTLNPSTGPYIGTSTIPAANCALAGCTSFPATNMNVNPTQATASYDPIANHVLIGSGAWQCGQGVSLGFGCSSSTTQNPSPGGSYTLTRFGKGLAPGSSISSVYSHSSGNLALWIWSGDTGFLSTDFLNFSIVAYCFGAPITSAAPCAHYQQGIGANGGPIVIGLTQLGIVNRFTGLNWVSPFDWANSPPLSIQSLAPVLHEGSMTINPASVAGCTSPYPIGGYDC